MLNKKNGAEKQKWFNRTSGKQGGGTFTPLKLHQMIDHPHQPLRPQELVIACGSHQRPLV